MEMIKIEVAFAMPYRQKLIEISVAEGTSARQAVIKSGIQFFFPEIEMDSLALGIFSNSCQDDYVLRNGDRVEVYRPLICDPKEMRRQRAKR